MIRNFRNLAFVGVLASALTGSSFAISIRHELTAPQNVAFSATFPQAGLLVYSYNTSDKRSAFLVGDKFIMTAGHCLPSNLSVPTTITLNGVPYTTSNWVRHPNFNGGDLLAGYDICVARLTSRVLDIEPFELYQGTADIGATGFFAGFGGFGNGNSGANNYSWIRYAATNTIDYDGSLPNVLLGDFDKAGDASKNSLLNLYGISSSADPTSNEGTIIPGDSGGPLLIQNGGKYKVAGVNSAASFLGSPGGLYGDLSFWSRLNAPGLYAWAKDKLWENGRIDGQITLLDTTLTNLVGKTAVIKIRNVGSQTALETYNVPLTLSGKYSFVTPQRGNRDMQISVNGWLRKVVTVNITNNGPGGINAALINGDVNYDNFIGFDDFDLLSASFNLALGDAGYLAAADLNGDNFVGFDDFDILSANFNSAGDD